MSSSHGSATVNFGRFRTVEHFLRDACDMLDNWDRQGGSMFVADGETDISVPSDDNSLKKTFRRGEKKEKHSLPKEVTVR